MSFLRAPFLLRTSVRCFSSGAGAGAARVSVNGVSYRAPSPGQPVVCVLIDGGSQEYLAAASAAGRTPFLDSLLARGPGLGQGSPARGVHALVSGQIPTLTNPNNVAIVCGAPAAVTGISGNYFLDESGEGEPVERLMNSAAFLRAPTVFARLQQEADVNVTILTAKDKLLALLSSGLSQPGLTTALSIEKLASQSALTAGELASMTAGFYAHFESAPEVLAQLSQEQRDCIVQRAVPTIYNPHISLYLLELGLGLFRAEMASERGRLGRSIFYLSTTDYVQHKYMPEDEEALRFYAYVDRVLRAFDEEGAVLAVTADHGMNSKVGFDGQPKVAYVASELAAAGFPTARVVLPITDPYVKHHSSLGGYATVYLSGADKAPARVQEAMRALRLVPGVYTVLNREEACKAFELPGDRVGDIVLLGDASTVLGKTPADHDLKEVPHLRSHGSMDEATVPMLLNRRLQPEYERRMTTGKTRNYHLLDMALNGVLEQD